jgi:nicotinate-nucleotide pyrophosphorylase (carboxylating)
VALAEDGERDLTTEVTLARGRAPVVTGRLESRGPAVIAGLRYAEAIASGAGATIAWRVREGDAVRAGAFGTLHGALPAVLRAERPVLNVLQRATGIATLTRRYVDALAGTPCRLLHTRKTAPGLRLFDAAAVVAGGGEVHRLDLAHTVMINDNHWRALAGSGIRLDAALREARARGARACQVEVESEAAVREACAAGADRVLIDNQTPAVVAAWTALARQLSPGIEVEATGGISLDNVRRFAEAGADFVSVGALTHSVAAADIALTVSSQ